MNWAGICRERGGFPEKRQINTENTPVVQSGAYIQLKMRKVSSGFKWFSVLLSSHCFIQESKNASFSVKPRNMFDSSET